MNNPTTPQQQEHPPAYAYPAIDEISLVDIWLLLVRRKKLIIGTFLICLGITGLAIWLMKPIYESRATIEIAR